MYLITLILGLLASTAPVAETWNAERTYEEAYGWTLDLPGPDCDCLSYPIGGDPPAEDESRVYDGYVVTDYDEDVGTITLSHEGEDDLILDFAWLSEWLDIQEEADDLVFTWTPPSQYHQEDAVPVCEGGNCQCDGKCSACCPKGYLPDCVCAGSGKCKCVKEAEPAQP